MFQQHGGDNILNVSQDDDFCHLAMQLFRAAGHTFNVKASISNKKIQDFVYIDIQHNQVLSPTDWNYLNQVISASLLFSNGANYFDVPNCDIEIDYYAMSLNATNSERSPLAHEIHKVVSRLSMAPLLVILFEVNEFCLFSFAERKQGQQSTVILSDWFSLNSVTDVLLRVDATHFTNTSVIDFFYDFQYAIARPYYIYPISFEYAKYEMFPLKYFRENDVGYVDRETINEIFRDNYLLPLLVYKYDYVAEDSNKKGEQFFSTEDIALELLELEMDIMNSDEENAIFDDDLIDDKDFVCEEEDDCLDELDEDLFDDPIKMLKWIGRQKRV